MVIEKPHIHINYPALGVTAYQFHPNPPEDDMTAEIQKPLWV